MQETLEDALEEFKKATVKDNGIPVEDKVIIEKTKDAEHRKKVPAKDNPVSEEQRRKTLKIPIRKSKQNAYSGRVCISSDIKKKSSKLDINDYLKKEEPTEFVEPVYEDLYDLDYYQSRMNENNDPTWETQIVHNQVKSTERPMSSSDSDDDSDLPISSASLASDFIGPNVVTGQEMPDKILEQDNIKDEDPEEVEFIGFYKPAVQQPRPRHRNLLSSDREKGLILNNKMLTDESINIAMQILKRKFPETDGLKDATLGKVHQFSIFRNKLFKYSTMVVVTGFVLPTSLVITSAIDLQFIITIV